LSAGASTGSPHRCVRSTQRRPENRDRQHLHSDLAHVSRHRLVARPILDYIGNRCTGLGRYQMLPVGLALLEREPVRPREAPWPRWGCDRRWGARCSGTCDCPRFGGLTHPDDCRCVRRHPSPLATMIRALRVRPGECGHRPARWSPTRQPNRLRQLIMAEGQPHRCGCNRIGGGTASRPDGAQSSSAPP